MAVTVGNISTDLNNTTSISHSHTLNGASDLVVFVYTCEGVATLSNVLYGANTMTLAIRQLNTGASTAEIWYYEGATGSATITATVSSKSKVGWASIDFGNAGTPTDAIGRQEDATSNSSLTVSNVGDGDVLLDAQAHNTGTNTYTTPDQTIYLNLNSGGNSFLGSYQLGTAGGVMDWSWSTTTDTAHAAVRIPDANPPTAPRRRYVVIQ